MCNDDCYPKITTVFDEAEDSAAAFHYRSILCNTLVKIVPNVFSTGELDADSLLRRRDIFKDQLPIFTFSNIKEAPYNISFYLLSAYRANAFKFYFELISSWLVPGQRLDVVVFNAVDFRIPDFGEQPYTLSEMVIRVETEDISLEMKKNLALIGKEIRLGVASRYYARKILETKGLAGDEKTAMVQEQMASLSRRLPRLFDRDLFVEMQNVMVLCSEEFKRQRHSRHLGHVISTCYLFRRRLLEQIKTAPDRRHLFLRIFHTSVQYQEGSKKVIGIVVGVNFLNANEVLENRHILKAIKNYIPHVKEVEGSFFIRRRLHENCCTLYLEIEKMDGTPFNVDEIQGLKHNLSGDLKDRIEHLVHPLFMPRNDEEIFRNIVSLSDQIKSTKDQPQVFITFDEQNHEHLFFLVVLVRVMQEWEEDISSLFIKANSYLEYIHESKKQIGFLRKKYPKEACVFKVKFSKYPFLRDDHSIDLFKARQVISSELERVLGRKVRDYNGGMISKQHELLDSLRELLDQDGTYNDFMLENFFYSLKPAMMRNVLDPQEIKELFLMMQYALDHREPQQHTTLEIRRDLTTVMAMVTADQLSIRELIEREVDHLNIPSSKLARIFVNFYDICCFGFLYKSDDPYSQDHFCQILETQLSPYSPSRIFR